MYYDSKVGLAVNRIGGTLFHDGTRNLKQCSTFYSMAQENLVYMTSIPSLVRTIKNIFIPISQVLIFLPIYIWKGLHY